MGGKGELVTTTTNHVPAPTQEQLRIAHITQDNTMNDGEKAALLKMVRQVMEATKCNQFTAEIALYDSGNNVEDAVLTIIERNDDQEIWTDSKNRKTKKAAKALEEKENYSEKPRGGFRGRGRGRSERPERTDRDTNRDSNREFNNRDRETRVERGDRENRFDRGDRENRFDRENRGDRENRFENRPDRENRFDRNENRFDRETRPDGENRFERPERQEKFERGDRGNRSGRGRGSSGITRSGRGSGGTRGGSTRPPRREDRDRDREQGGGNDGGFSMSTWDNNMQNTKEEDTLNGDNEELNWNSTPLVFSRREPQPQAQPQPQQQPVQTYSSSAAVAKQPEPGKPMSFAAAAAMRKKVEVAQPAPGPIEPPQRSYEKECQPSPSVSPQKPYQQQSIFGSSLDGPMHGSDNLNLSRGSANDQMSGLTFTNRAHAPSQGYSSDTVQNLTNQLKNDLGISISAAPSSGANTSSNVANLLSSFQSSTGDAKQQQQPRFASTPQSSYTNTVEFVTGGDVSATATDYQFGFYADSSPTTRENEVDSYKQASNYLASANAQQTEISPKRLEIDHALSKLNHIDVSPAKSTAQASTTQPTSYAPTSHQTNGHTQQQAQQQQVQAQVQQQQQQAQDQLNKLRAGSGLSYANTTNLSYPNTQTTKTQQPNTHILTISHPNDAQRAQQQSQIQQQAQQQNAQVQTQGYQAQQVAQQQQQQAMQQQQHHQQSPAQQTQQQQMSQAPLYPQAQNFAAYSNPYMNSYLNMNMYSPVTAGMRTDDAGMAAFLGYPFMNQMSQMDIASLTAMLPPAMASATASTAQAPPPTMQSHLQQHPQHTQSQHRADQQHYDMPKTYSNQNLGAVTMANNTNLASAQQRSTMDNANNSAVPPPPGFTGPPSNIPAATALFQPNLSSLFQMPASYAPNLSPFPLHMFNQPQQHKIPAAMFQQTMDDGDAQKMYGQQKMYQGQDKFSGAKDRGLNNIGGAQPTPPPQMAQNNFAYGGMMGQGMNQHKPKNPYWNA